MGGVEEIFAWVFWERMREVGPVLWKVKRYRCSWLEEFVPAGFFPAVLAVRRVAGWIQAVVLCSPWAQLCSVCGGSVTEGKLSGAELKVILSTSTNAMEKALKGEPIACGFCCGALGTWLTSWFMLQQDYLCWNCCYDKGRYWRRVTLGRNTGLLYWMALQAGRFLLCWFLRGRKK